jgi:predicted porin
MEIYRMKKSLFAVAALSAIAGAAQAQSSVTVYGIVDAGYVGSNQKLAGAPSTTQPQQATNSAFGQSAESTSRLGFKGTEDLGGGLSAFFTAETSLTPDSANMSTLNNRQSFVGLKKNGVGQFAFGTQYTTIFNAAALTDPGMLNNVTGNVIYAVAPVGGTTVNGVTSANNTSVTGQTDAFATRAANQLSVASDTFAGFQVNAMYTLNNSNSTQLSSSSGGSNNFNGWGLGANYTWNKLFLTANYQALKSAATTYNSLTSPLPAIWGGTTYQGSQTQDNQAYIAGTYDFGILKAYAQWVSRKATDTVNSNYYAKRNAQQLGVRSYITPTIEAWASVGNGKVTAFGVSNPSANFTGYQLGGNYYISKRTNLYAIYGSNQTAASTASTAYSANNYALGVRHTF